MEQEKIDRINELAKKAKDVGLTPEEKEEQRLLRNEYIQQYRQGLKNVLDNTYIQYEDGTKVKVQPKSDKLN